MKKRLLLYLCKLDYPGNIPIAATLAWLCKENNFLFDHYHGSHHSGIHFPGGDSRNLEIGKLTGGTISGDRHFQELFFLLLNFDVTILSLRQSPLLSALKNMSIPILSAPDQINLLYKEVFSHFRTAFPSKIVMIGSRFEKNLAGLDSYLYPEIYYNKAIGVLDTIGEKELRDLCREGSKIFCLFVRKGIIDRLKKSGYHLEVIDQLSEDDDYLRVTTRLAWRWKDRTGGWILGDPTLIACWLPKSCEEGLTPLYGIPQRGVLKDKELGDLISSKNKIVYGRQYSDQDFFELSKKNLCMQVIDPFRPPFQSVKHAEYLWNTPLAPEGFYDDDLSDEALRQLARKNTVFISLMIWSGMIREVVNFYPLMDLISMTGLRCGLVVTAQTYEYMMHSPFELLTVPLDQGGVYPLVEPVLGSCGVGVGIESLIKPDTLKNHLRDGLSRILQKVKKEPYLPKGWWTTMDTDLERCNWWDRPKPFRLMRYSPYFQWRYTEKENAFANNSRQRHEPVLFSRAAAHIDKMKTWIHQKGYGKHFSSYRPYEFFKAGPLKKEVIESAKSAGLQYMFTKSGFNDDPEAKYMDESFIALNYTAGQWDGWTPFETINDVSDLKKAERRLLKRKKPGWIVSSLDSCLWTFSGEFWKRADQLYKIAEFCATGGHSKRLINVKPITIARYARIVAQQS